MREGVAVWPSKMERILGRLTLVKQQHVMFLAWLPYGCGALHMLTLPACFVLCVCVATLQVCVVRVMLLPHGSALR